MRFALAIEPDIRSDLEAVAGWLGAVLPCTHESNEHGHRCTSQYHTHPCPRRRLDDYATRLGDPTRTTFGLVQSGCALARLFKYVRCRHQGAHREGCNLMVRLGFAFDLEERHGIRPTRYARRPGERQLPCFNGA